MKRLYISRLIILAAILCSNVWVSVAQTSTYNYIGSVVTYTVPAGVTSIGIQANGAQGGNTSAPGGLGAMMYGVFAVTPGHVLSILVGQHPASATNTAGGGGGSFVWDNASTALPMIAAGGGGGGGLSSSPNNGLNAVVTANGVNGLNLTSGGGTGGNGGTIPTGQTWWAGGGAGWLTSGNNGSNSSSCGNTCTGGATPLGGGAGGTFGGTAGSNGNGGFGGGGGAEGRCGAVGGGGGGGYSGGGAGAESGAGPFPPAGGGGSYNAGTGQVNSVGNTGNGLIVITVLCANPGTITGNTSICMGASTSLNDLTGATGGTWTSSNPSAATVNSSTGAVTSVGVGTTTITYNVPNPCGPLATAVVTINANPDNIVGSSSACTGAITTLTEDISGGTWGTSNPGVASVDGFGNVTGISIGAAIITYTLPSTCYVTQSMTVNSSPGPITGIASVCQGSTTILSDAIGGGTWVSTATSIANIDGLGNVTGIAVAGGTSNIIYTLLSGCSSTTVVTVNPLPNAFLLSGTSSYCSGGSTSTNIFLTGSAIGVNYQLFNGAITVGSPVAGTGLLLNFGAPTSSGTYLVVGTNATTGCVNTMNLTAVVTVKPLPIQFVVTGGGSYCEGAGGVHVGLSSSASGVNYQLLLNGFPIGGTVGGNGLPIDFGFQASPGVYTVTGTTSGAAPFCSNTMIGSVSVTTTPLPALNNITGGGSYCSGSAGVPIGLDFSSGGISYQLYNGASPQGSPVTGTGGSLTFGLQTIPGLSYSVLATNTSTGCTSQMNGFTFVNIAIPPNVYDVTGGGTLCAGGSGYSVGIDNSDPGVSYQLYNSSTPIGSPVSGISGPFDFGVFTDAGSYTVVGVDQTFFCVSNMNDTAEITVNLLPIAYNVTGGGNYCTGGTGVPVGLEGSQLGITYSLFDNLGFVASFDGTGAPINFGLYTIAGNYTVVGNNPATTCINNMSGAAPIGINSLPVAYNLTGGGSYCAGGAGIDLGLEFSTPGINYQLYNGALPAGAPIPGTGLALDFGYQTANGTYTIVGVNSSTTCVANMSGSGTVSINPLPVLYSVSGGGSYCAGDAGKMVSISNSNTGISYQLYNNTTTVIGSPVAGTGSGIDFGLQTAAGAYTVIAMDTATMCSRNMSGVATVVVNQLPGVFSVSGGGVYCEGGAGSDVGLSGSNAGIHYLLYDAGALESTVTGSGSTLDFGNQSAVGTYTVTATNVATGCSTTMDGNAIVTTNPLPTQYAITGGGSYCTGSGSAPSVGLTSSNAGINYQLFRGGAPLGGSVPGTGAALDFGTQSTAGIYTIMATDATTSCTKNMSGSAVVTVSALPSVYAVTGGGNYCAGASGLHVYMAISNPGIEYILHSGGVVIDSIMGTGAGIDFGLQSVAGTYTATAVNPTSGCTSNMSGSATITINSLPALHNVTVSDGGNYCATGSGVHIGLNGSNSGINYQLHNTTTTVGSMLNGTGSTIDFGVHATGNYTVVATNATTGCTSNMTGSARVNAIPLPTVYSVTGGGNYCGTGLGVHIGISGADSGTQYQLYHGSAPVTSILALTGGAIDFGMYTGAGTYTVSASNGGALACNANMSGSAVVAVYPVIVPSVSIASGGGDVGCSGVASNFTATSANGGTAPVYDWSVNGTSMGAGSAFSYVPTDGDMVTVRLHSNGICAIPDTATSTIRMTVSIPQAPSVHIAATPGNISCQGSPVTFEGTPMYGGSHPTYSWVKNGSYVIGSGPSLTYVPADHDIIVLLMGSDFPCRLLDSVFSNTITMQVDPNVIPTVSITASPGTQIGPGELTILTANVVNPGATPKYQWLLNGRIIGGATNSSYSSTSFANNDSVSCEVIGGCDLKSVNSVIITVTNEGVGQITSAGVSDIKLVPNPNKGIFTVKGTLASKEDEEVYLEVTNMLGQIVYANKIMSQNGEINTKIQVDGSLANGMYIMNLHSKTQNNEFHFVIEQ